MSPHTDLTVSAYRLVRRPERNVAPAGDIAGMGTLRRAGNHLYAGIDRGSWDLWKAWFGKKLSPALAAEFEVMQQESSDRGFDSVMLFNRQLALGLLDAVDPQHEANEVICLGSPELAQRTGFSEAPPPDVQWLGFDPFELCWCSLLYNGLYQLPEVFPDWLRRLNRAGLLDSADAAMEFTAEYKRKALSDEVEEIPYSDTTSSAILVGRCGVNIGVSS